MRARRANGGFTIIELMITLAVLGVVIMIGLPSMSAWLQNTQIRSAGEGILSGLQLARAEALRRNASVRFQLMSNLTSACAPSVNSGNWVVSLNDATSLCDKPPTETLTPGDPMIIQKKSSTEGTRNAEIAATGGAVAVFNGLGRLTGAGNFTQIELTNTQGGACQKADGSGGPMRCLRIMLGTGGGVRMCDPIVTDTSDPRCCVPEKALCAP